MSPVLILVFLIIYILLHLWSKHFKFWQKRNIANVPGLFSGCFKDLITFKTSFHHHLTKIYKDPKFQNASVVGVYAAHTPALLVREPELLKSIFIADYVHFRARYGRNRYKGDPLGQHLLFMSPYPFCKEMRPKMSPMFTGSSMKRLYPLIQVVAGNLEKYLMKMTSGVTLELKSLASNYTIDIINSTILGIESNVLVTPNNPLTIEIKRLGEFNTRRTFDWLILYVIPKLSPLFRSRVFFESSNEFIKLITQQLISQRETCGVERHDFIQICCKLKQEALSSGQDISQLMIDLAAQVALLLYAGFDTTSTTLSNALFELAKHLEIQERVRSEIKQVFPEDGGEISYEDLSKLKYLEMVLHETLRRYPTLPLLEREHNLADDGTKFSLRPYADYQLPSGMPVFISLLGLHYDPKVSTRAFHLDFIEDRSKNTAANNDHWCIQS